MATDSRAAIIVNQGGIAPPQWISAPAVVTLLVTLFAPPVKPVGAQSLQEQVLTPPAALVQNADTTHGSPLTLIRTAGQKPFFVVPNFAPDQHPVNEWIGYQEFQHPLTLPAVVVSQPPFQAAWIATQRYAWQNPDTTHGIPETLLAPFGAKPTFVAPFFAPDTHPVLDLKQQDTPLGSPATLQGMVTGACVTWNPADAGANVTLSNANLTASSSSVPGLLTGVRATISQSSGKYYYEVLWGGTWGGSPTVECMGIALSTTTLNTTEQNAVGFYNYSDNGIVSDGSNNGVTNTSTTFASGDVVMCAVDLGAGKIWWGKNGSWTLSGNPGAGTNPAFTTVAGTFFPCVNAYSNATATAGFASNSWAFSAPSGFTSWPCPPLPPGLGPTIPPPFFGPDEHPSSNQLNADTTRGTPLTLIASGPLPPGLGPAIAQNFQLHNTQFQPEDTSHGSPPSLIAVVQPPFKAEPFVATPAYPWVGQDTTRGVPLTLLTPATQIPPFQINFVVTPAYPWVDQETSRGTPLTLRSSGTQPFFVAPPPGPDHHPVNEWMPADTSSGTSLPERAAAPPTPPPFQASWVAAPSYLWIVQDTSHGQPLTLKPPPLPPPPFLASFVAAPTYAWVVQDTSRGTPLTFFPTGGFSGTPGVATLIKTGQVPTLIIPFVGTPGVAQIIKFGQVPTLTVSPSVLFVIDYEFYELIQARPWSEPIIVRPWSEKIPARSWTTIYGDVVVAIGPKDPVEVVIATIDFTQEMVLLSETITSIVSIVATTESGTDPTPSAILSGAPSGVGTTKVQNVIIGGLTGVGYGIKATVTTTAGRTLVGDTLLKVGVE